MTQALARDQANKLAAVVDRINCFRRGSHEGVNNASQKCVDYVDGDIITGVIDGDTTYSERERLLTVGNIIITNPDILHYSILPHVCRVCIHFTAMLYF